MLSMAWDIVEECSMDWAQGARNTKVVEYPCRDVDLDDMWCAQCGSMQKQI